MRKLWFVGLIALAGCGVAGAPERPAKAGLNITGQATVGIAKNGS